MQRDSKNEVIISTKFLRDEIEWPDRNKSRSNSLSITHSAIQPKMSAQHPMSSSLERIFPSQQSTISRQRSSLNRSFDDELTIPHKRGMLGSLSHGIDQIFLETNKSFLDTSQLDDVKSAKSKSSGMAAIETLYFAISGKNDSDQSASKDSKKVSFKNASHTTQQKVSFNNVLTNRPSNDFIDELGSEEIRSGLLLFIERAEIQIDRSFKATTIYHIRVAQQSRKQYMIYRRFKQFFGLSLQLELFFHDQKRPVLPTKSSRITSSQLLISLQAYFNTICANKVFRESSIFQEWISSENDVFYLSLKNPTIQGFLLKAVFFDSYTQNVGLVSRFFALFETVLVSSRKETNFQTTPPQHIFNIANYTISFDVGGVDNGFLLIPLKNERSMKLIETTTSEERDSVIFLRAFSKKEYEMWKNALVPICHMADNEISNISIATNENSVTGSTSQIDEDNISSIASNANMSQQSLSESLETSSSESTSCDSDDLSCLHITDEIKKKESNGLNERFQKQNPRKTVDSKKTNRKAFREKRKQMRKTYDVSQFSVSSKDEEDDNGLDKNSLATVNSHDPNQIHYAKIFPSLISSSLIPKEVFCSIKSTSPKKEQATTFVDKLNVPRILKQNSVGRLSDSCICLMNVPKKDGANSSRNEERIIRIFDKVKRKANHKLKEVLTFIETAMEKNPTSLFYKQIHTFVTQLLTDDGEMKLRNEHVNIFPLIADQLKSYIVSSPQTERQIAFRLFYVMHEVFVAASSYMAVVDPENNNLKLIENALSQSAGADFVTHVSPTETNENVSESRGKDIKGSIVKKRNSFERIHRRGSSLNLPKHQSLHDDKQKSKKMENRALDMRDIENGKYVAHLSRKGHSPRTSSDLSVQNDVYDDFTLKSEDLNSPSVSRKPFANRKLSVITDVTTTKRRRASNEMLFGTNQNQNQSLNQTPTQTRSSLSVNRSSPQKTSAKTHSTLAISAQLGKENFHKNEPDNRSSSAHSLTPNKISPSTSPGTPILNLHAQVIATPITPKHTPISSQKNSNERKVLLQKRRTRRSATVYSPTTELMTATPRVPVLCKICETRVNLSLLKVHTQYCMIANQIATSQKPCSVRLEELYTKLLEYITQFNGIDPPRKEFYALLEDFHNSFLGINNATASNWSSLEMTIEACLLLFNRLQRYGEKLLAIFGHCVELSVITDDFSRSSSSASIDSEQSVFTSPQSIRHSMKYDYNISPNRQILFPHRDEFSYEREDVIPQRKLSRIFDVPFPPSQEKRLSSSSCSICRPTPSNRVLGSSQLVKQSQPNSTKDLLANEVDENTINRVLCLEVFILAISKVVREKLGMMIEIQRLTRVDGTANNWPVMFLMNTFGDSSSESIDVLLSPSLHRSVSSENMLPVSQLALDVLNLPQSSQPLLLHKKAISIQDFELLKMISSGAFGRVFLARKKATNDLYAIKTLPKKDIFRKNLSESVLNERNILASINNPFVVKLVYAFQSETNLYLVMEYCPGGDVATLLQRFGSFCLRQSCLYIAEVILAVGTLHNATIVHRDIKPDNIVINAEGHLLLTDFGLSSIGVAKDELPSKKMNDLSSEESNDGLSSILLNSSDSSPFASLSTNTSTEIEDNSKRRHSSKVGTIDYLAPEVLAGYGYGFEADWWAVGILLYEFITGIPPFNNEDKQIIFQRIIAHPADCSDIDFSDEEMTPEVIDLITKFLHPNPAFRMGSKGMEEIKSHPFFTSIKWDTFYTESRADVFVPSCDPLDTSYFEDRRGDANSSIFVNGEPVFSQARDDDKNENEDPTEELARLDLITYSKEKAPLSHDKKGVRTHPFSHSLEGKLMKLDELSLRQPPNDPNYEFAASCSSPAIQSSPITFHSTNRSSFDNGKLRELEISENYSDSTSCKSSFLPNTSSCKKELSPISFTALSPSMTLWVGTSPAYEPEKAHILPPPETSLLIDKFDFVNTKVLGEANIKYVEKLQEENAEQ